MKTTYVQDPETGKFVEKQKFLAGSASAVVHTMEPFISPIDGREIRSPAQLAAHNREHGVTDRRDYGPEWFKRKGRENELKRQNLDAESKAHRIELLKKHTQHVRT